MLPLPGPVQPPRQRQGEDDGNTGSERAEQKVYVHSGVTCIWCKGLTDVWPGQ